MFDLFVSDKLPEKVMAEVILGWLGDFSNNQALYRQMGIASLRIRPVMFGFALEAVPVEDPAQKEVA